MSETEIAQYAGHLFLAYATGWGSAILILTFKKVLEKL